MASSLLPSLQKYIRASNVSRQMVRSPQYDEQAGFGDVQARMSSAQLLESPMRAIAVGECSVADNQFAYFLDGIQRSWLLYYQDYVPVYYGYAAAVIRQRQAALMSTWEYEPQEAIYVPFSHFDREELARLQSHQMPVVDTTPRISSEALNDVEKAETPKQPMAMREAARNTISDARERLEAKLAETWIKREEKGWLVMDGSISVSPITAEHPGVVGLIKSHNTQYFNFPEQETIFSLKLGERSATFIPRGRYQVCSWYLRLRDVNNEDLHFGLVRVEASLQVKERADEISRWIMTERRPLSLPDSRWDKMIYPIRDCEQFLRSQEPSRSSFGWLG